MKVLSQKGLVFLATLLVSINIYADDRVEKRYVTSDLEKYYQSGICESCNLINASVMGHPHSSLAKSNLINVFFVGNLEGSDFSATNLTNASFFDVNLPNARFNSAILINTNFLQAELSQADFTNAVIKHADFRGAVLCGANITPLQLLDAKLSDKTLMPDCTYYIPAN